MKLRMRYGDLPITCMFRWSWAECGSITLWSSCTVAWKLKKDDFNGWVYLVGEDWLLHE
jgi:hypothetical protein